MLAEALAFLLTNYLWGIAFAGLGLLLYLATPVLIGPYLPRGKRLALARMYFGHALAAARRAAIVERVGGGDHTLVSTSFNPEYGEEAEVGGETKHFPDDHGMMSRMQTYPLALVPEKFATVVDPMLCEVGREAERQDERGEDVIDIDENGYHFHQNSQAVAQQAFNLAVDLPERPSLVSLHDCEPVLGNNASPRSGEIAYDWTKKSQAGFTSPNLVEAGSMIVAFLVVFGVMWLLKTQGGTVASSVSSVNLFVGVLV